MFNCNTLILLGCYIIFFLNLFLKYFKKLTNHILLKSLIFLIQIMVLMPILNFEFFEFDLLNFIFNTLIILLLQVILTFSNYFKILLKK